MPRSLKKAVCHGKESLVTITYSCMAPQIKIGHLFPLSLHKIVTNNIKKQVGYLISYSELHTNSFLQNEERYRGTANYEKLHTPSLYLCLPCLNVLHKDIGMGYAASC